MARTAAARFATLAMAFTVVQLLSGCAARQREVEMSPMDAARHCNGAAELRVVNRTNTAVEVVEYDASTGTTTVLGVAERGVSNFPARGDVNLTYALRPFGSTSRGWLTNDRITETPQSRFAIERRCR
jgi:hypothetical protein